MEDKQRVIFSGSRYWKKETPVVDALMELSPLKWTVITGGAKGLDRIAEDTARAMGFDVEVYPAKWRQHGNAAGPIRNRLMLSRPNVALVIAFPDPKRSIGTYDMIEIAELAGIKLVVVDA